MTTNVTNYDTIITIMVNIVTPRDHYTNLTEPIISHSGDRTVSNISKKSSFSALGHNRDLGFLQGSQIGKTDTSKNILAK